MNLTEVTEGVFRLSANGENILFESLWPIPHGVSMNSYIVKGEKTAIVDGVCGWDGIPQTLLAQLEKIKVKPDEIDYIIINHMEPDHSGWIEDFRDKIKKDVTIVTHAKSIPLLERFFNMQDVKTQTVKSGDTLDLGAGKVLAFEEIPNVHWPETIATFDTSTGTLMPCDAFGHFGRIDDSCMYDEQLTPEKDAFFEKEMLRYYSNIVGAFSQPVISALKKAASLPIKIIAPGHGVVWRKNPSEVVHRYQRYASYSQGPAKRKVTIIWGSMYGKTEEAIQSIEDALREQEVEYAIHRVPVEDNYSFILRDVWESSGVVLACPTYEYKAFPPLAMALEEIANKKAFNRKAFYCGSYGWAPGADREIQEINERKKLRWSFVPKVEFKGSPSDEEKRDIKQRVKELIVDIDAWHKEASEK